MGHQGEALRVILARQKVNISSLAEKMGVSRSAVYQWFDLETISYENLERVSKALKQDFFELIERELNVARPLKKFNPIPTVATVSESSVSYGEKTAIQVFLDGTEESLERLIEKLRALNNALHAYQEQLNS